MPTYLDDFFVGADVAQQPLVDWVGFVGVVICRDNIRGAMIPHAAAKERTH
jgi:hypothetical protein